MGRTSLIILLVIAAAVIFFSFTYLPGEGDPQVIRPEVGYLAPDFALADMEGNVVRLSQLRGQPVFINFWATWCPSCDEEMPTLQKAFDDRGKEVKFLTINLINTEKSLQEVSRYLDQNGLTFPVLLDQNGEVVQEYLVRGIPTSFFLDAQGVIRYKHLGPLDDDSMAAALKKVT